MIMYAGFLFILLSSIYTFSFAGHSWKENNKLAAMGAVLIEFAAMAVSYIAFLRT